MQQENSFFPRAKESIKSNLEALAKLVKIKKHHGRIILAIDAGSSSIRFSLSDQEDENVPWINMPFIDIEFDGRKAKILDVESLELFIQMIKFVVTECQLTADDILAITGFTNSLVVVGKDGQAITLLDNPSYEDQYAQELDTQLQRLGFSDNIRSRLTAGKHSSLAKLLKLMRDPQAFIQNLGLNEEFFEDPEQIKFTTFQGYLLSRLFDLEFGQVSATDWQSFGNPELAQMQNLLLEYGFPPHAIMNVYAQEFKPQEEGPPVYTAVDFQAELGTLKWLFEEKTAPGVNRIPFSTDSVGKFITEGLVHGLRQYADYGLSYLTQELLGNGYGKVRDIIAQYQLHPELGLDERVNHYRETDRIVAEQLSQIKAAGVENYRPSSYFFPQEDGNYQLLDQNGESYTSLEDLAAKLFTQEGKAGVERLIFEIINGIGFSLRQKLAVIEEKLNASQNLPPEEQKELQVLFYGGMAAHSFNPQENEWGDGFLSAIIASLPAHVKPAILQLQNAAQAVVISEARKRNIPYDGELEVTLINRATGALEQVYQDWDQRLEQLIAQGKVSKDQHARIVPNA